MILFQTIQFSLCTQFKGKKQFFFKLFCLVNQVKWFQVLLCITNNTINHQPFIYTQLKDQTVQFSVSDSNKTAGEEARRQLHKNAASNLEQVLAATPNKTPTVRPPASYHENYPS